jgi:glyoxylase-like metal-dependent hydrolase (beta-lactamase superfamily II)
VTGWPAGSIAAIAALGAVAASAPAQAAPPRLTLVPLRGGVELVRGGESGNVLVIRDGDDVMLVDAMGAADREPLRKTLGPLAGGVRLVVNTHYHEDHLGGNAAFGPRAVTLAHQSVPAEARKDTSIALLDWHRSPSPADAIPLATIPGDASLTFGSHVVELFHLAHAHTGGDLAVRIGGADVLHTGDVYEIGAFPFIDVWAGGTMDGMIAAVDRLLSLAGERTIVIPGHGPPSNRAELAAYRDMLATVRDSVRSALSRKATLEETLALELAAPYAEGRGTPRAARRFVALVYLSSGGKP